MTARVRKINMSKAATKTGKGGVPKTPKDNTSGGTSTGSTIKQYMTWGGSPGNTHPETLMSIMTDKKTGGLEKKYRHLIILERNTQLKTL